MELYAALVLLYLWECLARLPAGGVAFARRGRGVAVGPGWQLLAPWPTDDVLLASSLPLVEDADGALRAREPVSRLPLATPPGDGARLVLDVEGRVEARGRLVWVDGRPFARGITKGYASAFAAFVRELRALPADRQRARLDRAGASGFDLDGFRNALARFERVTRWLGRALLVYFGVFFAGLPLALLLLGPERGLLFWLPPVLVLHAVTLWLLARAHRRLRPDARGERFELVLAAAVYPPALLRARQALADAVCAGWHPAVLACAGLGGQAGRAWLRERVAHAVHDVERGGPLAAAERAALLALLAEVGESADALLAAPAADDPVAERYCPVCRCDYRGGVRVCADCGVALVAYARNGSDVPKTPASPTVR